MKKNGYTLIELIVTIGLLATASTVVLINMIGMKGNQDIEQEDKFKETIESAACAYMDMIEQTKLREVCKINDTLDDCKIPLEILISSQLELVESTLKDPATNCTTTQEKDNIYVQVNFKQSTVNGKTVKEKTCKFVRTKEEMCNAS